MIRNFRFLSLVVLLVFASGIYAVPPPRGIDPLEAKRKARIDKIKREKARRDSINCYLRERKKISDGGTSCIYKCPSVKGRVESNNIGPGFSCPTMMNVLRREWKLTAGLIPIDRYMTSRDSHSLPLPLSVSQVRFPKPSPKYVHPSRVRRGPAFGHF